MALVTEQFCFWHMPKTGGSFVRNTLLAMFKQSSPKGNHEHNTITQLPSAGKNRYQFTFLRNPFHWMMSVYNWCDKRNWDGVKGRLGPCGIFHLCEAPTFNEFVDKYLGIMPGALSSLYGKYADSCDFVGRTENLAEDLCYALQFAGCKFDSTTILIRSPRNVGTYPCTIKWTKKRAEKFLECEEQAFVRYGLGALLLDSKAV